MYLVGQGINNRPGFSAKIKTSTIFLKNSNV